MGVPAFFRWLSRKYPTVIIECLEDKPLEVDGVRPPVDTLSPNPNGVEFDNLYLDMNGIIHPCTHPEDKPAPQTEDEMMIAIFECIQRLFAIVRPRKLLYMAIDGVAPRAKMNQQRSRRFRASKESHEKVLLVERLRDELTEKGMHLPPQKKDRVHFDSNCITPGTPFMDRLSKCLQYYVYERLNTDPGWKDIKVILSDANVPGEGEHKIMDFIRRQRAQPNHNPNTQHVLCGADADLIMLGLATHEPHFTIIREEFKPNKPKPCDLCRQMGHEMTDCLGLSNSNDVQNLDDVVFGEETKYIFVRLSVLREYLRRDLAMPGLPFPYEFERAIDDWVFMCFFVGNDFLPHLPSLEIREGAIDRLVKLYKSAVFKTGGFLTKSGIVDPSRVQMIMQDLGKVEDAIFKERQAKELHFRARNKAKKPQNFNGPAFVSEGQFAPQALGGKNKVESVTNCKQQAYDMRVKGLNMGKRKMFEQESEDDEPPDEVRLYEDGFKDRYYEAKFGVLPEEVDFRYLVSDEYTIGLCWVLRYYYQGCASWKWYYPYHYAPFASDFVNIGTVKNEFEKGTQPFKPMEQLMSVFPAASRSHVPKPLAEYMIDPDSMIIDFYPEDFKIDLNGKKFAWQGVALLPFVDEDRLKRTVEPLYSKLTEDEKRRNERGDDRLYIRESHTGYDFLKSCYDTEIQKHSELQIEAGLFQGVSGTVLQSDDNVEHQGDVRSPIKALEGCYDNRVICVRYKDPKYHEDFVFSSARLSGAIDPPIVLKPGDLNRRESKEWKPRMRFQGEERRDQARLDNAGHRMVQHYTSDTGYLNVPPPKSIRGDRKFQRMDQAERQVPNDRYSWEERPRRGFSNHPPPTGERSNHQNYGGRGRNHRRYGEYNDNWRGDSRNYSETVTSDIRGGNRRGQSYRGGNNSRNEYSDGGHNSSYEYSGRGRYNARNEWSEGRSRADNVRGRGDHNSYKRRPGNAGNSFNERTFNNWRK